jgi:hypothetical protein
LCLSSSSLDSNDVSHSSQSWVFSVDDMWVNSSGHFIYGFATASSKCV